MGPLLRTIYLQENVTLIRIISTKLHLYNYFFCEYESMKYVSAPQVHYHIQWNTSVAIHMGNK